MTINFWTQGLPPGLRLSASQDDLNRVASVLERAQGIKNVDITKPETWKNAANGDRKIVEELAREWEALPEGAKQVAGELLILGRAAGLRDIPGYISQVAREAPGAFYKKGLTDELEELDEILKKTEAAGEDILVSDDRDKFKR